MAAKRKSGRATAEAAYANLLKDNTMLVGNVGETFDAYLAILDDAAHARERYEDARAAAVKAGALTNDQLDQMGYPKTTKLPAAPGKKAASNPPPGEAQARSNADSSAPRVAPPSNGETPNREPVTLGAGANGKDQS